MALSLGFEVAFRDRFADVHGSNASSSEDEEFIDIFVTRSVLRRVRLTT